MFSIFGKKPDAQAEKTALNRGQMAEQEAFDYLCRHGLKGLTRNYTCRYGEIDLIMSDDDMVVFVEVRYRKKNNYGSALESVNPNKMRKLRLAAQHYLCTHRHRAQQPCRFDVLAWQDNTMNWIKNAFY